MNSKDPLQEIGSLIRTARERQGISIEQLALESRVSSKHIKNIETANRGELPEDTFLTSYLNKVLKTLKIANPDQVINQYRVKEGDYIVQSIIDVQEINSGKALSDGKYFKVYHLYILFAVFIILCAWIVINKANEDYEYSPVLSNEHVELKNTSNIFDIFSRLNPIKPEEKDTQKETDLEKAAAKKDKEKDEAETTEKATNGAVLKENGRPLKEENLAVPPVKPIEKTPEETKPSPAPRKYISRGSGAYGVRLSVRDKAWVQVIGVGSKKILYEGDISDQNIAALDLKDDVGFVLATGNAGAFDVDVGSGNFKLGSSGQLIKWFYPESARTIYKNWSKSQQRVE